MKIYVVRHGETAWNREEVFRGRKDIPLNDVGIRQAERTGRFFADKEVSAIYSSPLARARQTASAISEAKGLPVKVDDAFIDMDFGEWQGRPLREVREKYADLYRLWRERPEAVQFPGGENLPQVRVRAWEGLQEVVRENPEKTVLILAHRVITKVLICAGLGLDDSHFWRIKQDTTAVNCLEYHRGFFVTSLVNDTCHLKSIHPDSPRKDF